MSDSVNLNLKPRMAVNSGNTRTINMPNNNYSSTKASYVGKTALLDHANLGYNQLAIGKTLPAEINKMYSQLYNNTDKQGQSLLNTLLKNGKLLSADSNDSSTTIQNLYNIMKKPRASGLNSKKIIKETLKTMANPYLITQTIGKIPDTKMSAVIKTGNVRLWNHINEERVNNTYDSEIETDMYPIIPAKITGLHGSTCPAASVEFNLADKKPAEFVRYIEGLTSPAKNIKTTVKYSDLSLNMTEALGFLAEENTEYKPLDWKKIKVTIKPDENAYIRAKIQEDDRAKDTRSVIDVLMQSAFMNLGSRNTYNSLTDNRSKDTGEGKGLNQSEISFVETVVDPESRTIPQLYMELDDDLTKVVKYYRDFKTTRKHFMDSIDKNKNILVGFMTGLGENGNLIYPGGHEIMLTNYDYDQNGKLWFEYNDTDDGNHFAPSWISADKFIPTVHHANIPQSVLKGDMPLQDSTRLAMQYYKDMKQQNSKQN